MKKPWNRQSQQLSEQGIVPGEEIALALDIAATQFRSGNKYLLGTDFDRTRYAGGWLTTL